ncbi:MAG: hypothetical protein AB1404_10585, partial [Spirochaetota bacterium]
LSTQLGCIDLSMSTSLPYVYQRSFSFPAASLLHFRSLFASNFRASFPSASRRQARIYHNSLFLVKHLAASFFFLFRSLAI